MERRNDGLPLSRRIANAAGSQECENVKAIHTYVHARAMNVLEMQTIWSERPDISWAHSTGRMEGWDDVWMGTVTTYDNKCYERYMKIWPQFPDAGGKDPRPFYEIAMHCLTSEVIEVADDGETATSLFATPGFLFTVLSEDGKRYCRTIWERYGTDYVRENGKWVLLHEQVCPDFFIFSDAVNAFRGTYLGFKDKENYKYYNHYDPTPFTLREPMHHDHTPIRPAEDTVPAPVPHATLPEQNMGNILPSAKRPKRMEPIGF